MPRYLSTGYRSSFAIAVALGFGVLVGDIAAQDGEVDMRSTLEGVFTEEQAERGQQLMWNICAECHFDEDYEGPFMQDWIGSARLTIESINKTNENLQKTIRDIKRDVEVAKNIVKAIGYLDDAIMIAANLLA